MAQDYNSLKSSIIQVDDGTVTTAKIAAGSITSSKLYVPYSVINVGTTAQQPTTPVPGDIRLNTDTFYTETYYNSAWHNLNFLGTLTTVYGVVGSFGGNVTQTGSKNRIHTFTTSGTFTIKGYPAGAIFRLLVVGGGGGGGTGTYGNCNGGGGAGGFLYSTLVVQSSESATYTVIIGNGGAIGASGENSSVVGPSTNLVAIGGGRGGGASTGDATIGGSGGGAKGNGSNGNGYPKGPGTLGQGNAGGLGDSWGAGGGGGGGGAGGVGINGGPGGVGGPGLPNPIATSTVGELVTGIYYLGGGGGAGGVLQYGYNFYGVGGVGGGGRAGLAGAVNTGGGGGAQTRTGSTWTEGAAITGTGGSGAVIIQLF